MVLFPFKSMRNKWRCKHSKVRVSLSVKVWFCNFWCRVRLFSLLLLLFCAFVAAELEQMYGSGSAASQQKAQAYNDMAGSANKKDAYAQYR